MMRRACFSSTRRVGHISESGQSATRWRSARKSSSTRSVARRMIASSRAYEANVTAMNAAKDMVNRALDI